MTTPRSLLCVLVLSLFTATVLAQSVTEPPAPACPSRPSPAPPSAYDPCLFPDYFRDDGFVPPGPPPAAPLSAADLNAAYIEQRPRYEYTAAKNRHEDGDTVTFVARVANRGQQSSGSFGYSWRIDGGAAVHGSHPSLDAGQMIELAYDWTWQTGAHTVTLELDPEQAITEVSEQNNVIEDRTDGLAVGFWVEQSVYDWFNANQINLGIGSVSWDDWARRQLDHWNQMFAAAAHPLTPDGIVERVRLDRVTILADGDWPDCSNTYWPEDKTVDLVWGFPSELVGVSSGHNCGEFNFYSNHPQFQLLEMPLLHEMSHARYLIDLYGLNVYVNHAVLTAAVDSAAPSLPVNRDVEQDGNFPLPVYLAIDGELLICSAKIGSSFGSCARGAEGTTPRSHATGALVNLATVRVQDGAGNLVQGSEALPLAGDWDDHLYFNRYPADLMSGGVSYEQHSAYAWNRIAGQRPVCGNFNAPCNIGEYLNDIPADNVLEIRDQIGLPMPGVQVAVFQPRPFPIWYGRYFKAAPDLILTSDQQGRASLGGQPFGSPPIRHTWGESEAVLLIRVTSPAGSAYRFFEVTEANEAYWFGHQDQAVYPLRFDLPPLQPPKTSHLPLVVNNFDPTQPLLALHFEGSFAGATGEPGAANGPTFTSGYSGQGALFDNGDTLTYDSAGNINRGQGAIEFWLQPSWNGNDQESYTFFEIGDSWFNRMRIMKDGANNFRFMVWSHDTEYGVAYNVAHWQAGQWHHVRVTWQDGLIALFLDGQPRGSYVGVELPARLAARLNVGSAYGSDQQAGSVIDELIISRTP